MPKKFEEKNNKGMKTTKSSTTKNNNKFNNKKVVKEEPKKVEVIEHFVEKKETKKGANTSLMNNTPFVVSLCAIILLVAALIFVLCTKRIPTTSNGEEIVATIDGKTITADELYLELKNNNGADKLITLIDEHIADKEVTVTEKDEEYVQGVVDYYKEYAKQYQTDLKTFLTNYVGLTGIEDEKAFYEFVLKDYKKTLAVQKFIIEGTEEDELKKYYEENYSDSLTAKHILIEVDSKAEDKTKAKKDAYNKAVKLIQKLKNTESKKLNDKFEELVEKNSDDTATYSTGGLIEDFTKDKVEEAFYEAAYELKDGEYTDEPVLTTYGYHIILKVSSTPVEAFEDILDDVKKGYAEKQLQEDATLFTIKWAELRDAYKFTINDDVIKKSYNETIENAKKTEN